MQNIIFALLLPLFAGEPAPAVAPVDAKPAPSKPAAKAGASEDANILYSLGFFIGHRAAPSLLPFGLQSADFTQFNAGFKDAVLQKPPKVDVNTYGPQIEPWAQARLAKKSQAQKDKSKDFLAKMAKEKGAVVSPTGLIYFQIKEGTGPQPSSTDTIKAHYTGKFIDGTKFDSSLDRGEPLETSLSTGIIACWTEGFPKMKVGGKARLICPSDIAYGDRGRAPVVKPGTTLDFTVELLEILK